MILRWETFRSLEVNAPSEFGNVVELVYGDILASVEKLHPIFLFAGGLGLLLLSFKLIDGVMANLSGEDLAESRFEFWNKKWPMFGLGCLVALVTMSVSIALTILVPLVAKGYAKREDVDPIHHGSQHHHSWRYYAGCLRLELA